MKSASFNRIRIYIKDENKKIPNSSLGEVKLTLHLRRKDGRVQKILQRLY